MPPSAAGAAETARLQQGDARLVKEDERNGRGTPELGHNVLQSQDGEWGTGQGPPRCAPLPTGETPPLPLSSGRATKTIAATVVPTGTSMGAPWFASLLALLGQETHYRSWEEEPPLEARRRLSPTRGFTRRACHCRLRVRPALANRRVAFRKGLEHAALAAPLGSPERWVGEQITGKYLDTSAHKRAFSQLFHTGVRYLIKPWAENSSSELKNHYIKESAGCGKEKSCCIMRMFPACFWV